MSKRRNLLGLMAAALLVSACYNEGSLVSNPAPLMQYQHKPSELKLLALTKSYAEAINQNLQDQVIHPGQYADYGVALARLGQLEQANLMFNNEKTFFPNSSRYVDFLKQTYTPAFCSDNRFDTSQIDLRTLEAIPIELTPEELAAQQELEADPAYQQMIKQQQQEEKAAQAAALKQARAERAKAKQAERKAQARAKEQARREKEKAKKAAEKERAKAKKAEQQAKEQAKKEALKAKEEARKAELKAKEEARKAELKAKEEAEKAQKAAEKEAEKAQKAAEKEAEKAMKEAEKAQKAAEKEAEKAKKEAEKAQKAAEEAAQ